jgi:hypothetical protein
MKKIVLVISSLFFLISISFYQPKTANAATCSSSPRCCGYAVECLPTGCGPLPWQTPCVCGSVCDYYSGVCGYNSSAEICSPICNSLDHVDEGCSCIGQWVFNGPCNAACGPGQRPIKNGCGSYDTQPCNLGPCCDPNAWTDTGGCSATCGAGTIPTVNDCGTVGSRACNVPAAFDGTYEDCTVTCGFGTEYDYSSNCPDVRSRGCQIGDWSAYSACTKSCRIPPNPYGTRTRNWTCDRSAGVGGDGGTQTEIPDCNLIDCDPEACDDNNQCSGFENCTDCIQDCGLVCSGITAWWQVRGGLVGAQNDDPNSFDTVIKNNMPDNTTCNEGADCIIAISATDVDGTEDTDGFPIMGSGDIETNGYTTERVDNISITNTKKIRYEERYQYFYRNSTLGLNPTDDFSGSAADASKPGSNGDYYSAGDLTIQNAWDVTNGEQYIIFVDGNLTLNGDNTDQLVTVEVGGFIAFIVSGDIIIEESLGNSTLTDLTPNLSGVFIADGIIDIQTRGFDNGGDDRFVGEGTFAGWAGIDLNRSFTDDNPVPASNRDIENTTKPVETFIYRPDFLVNLPDSMKIPVRVWQETN